MLIVPVLPLRFNNGNLTFVLGVLRVGIVQVVPSFFIQDVQRPRALPLDIVFLLLLVTLKFLLALLLYLFGLK